MAEGKAIANIVTRLSRLSFTAGTLAPKSAEQARILTQTYTLATIITKLVTQEPLDADEKVILECANREESKDIAKFRG